MRNRKNKINKQNMNILFYGRFEFENASTHFVHIFELVYNLSKLGHNVILSEIVRSKNKNELSFGLPSSLARLKNLDARIFLLSIIQILKQKTKPDVIYMREGLLNGGYYLAKLLKVPFVKEVNGITIDEIQIWKRRKKFVLKIVDKIVKFNLPRADKIIVVTEKIEQVLRDDYKIPEDKIVVIENGANINLFKPIDTIKARKELNQNQNNNYICFVGSLSPHQGIQYLIKCAPLILKKILLHDL